MSNTTTGNSVSAMASDVKAEASSLASDAKAAADKAGSMMQDQAGKFASKATEIGEQMYDRGVQASHAVGQTIEERPYVVAALAAAFGMLIGMAIARR